MYDFYRTWNKSSGVSLFLVCQLFIYFFKAKSIIFIVLIDI